MERFTKKQLEKLVEFVPEAAETFAALVAEAGFDADMYYTRRCTDKVQGLAYRLGGIAERVEVEMRALSTGRFWHFEAPRGLYPQERARHRAARALEYFAKALRETGRVHESHLSRAIHEYKCALQECR